MSHDQSCKTFSTWVNYYRIVRLDVQPLQPRVSRLLEDSRSPVSRVAWSRRKEWEWTSWKGSSRQDALNDTSRDSMRCTGTLMNSILRLLRDILWRYCVLHDLLRRFQVSHHINIANRKSKALSHPGVWGVRTIYSKTINTLSIRSAHCTYQIVPIGLPSFECVLVIPEGPFETYSQQLSTILIWKSRIPFELRRQANQGQDSTRLGDCPGTPRSWQL